MFYAAELGPVHTYVEGCGVNSKVAGKMAQNVEMVQKYWQCHSYPVCFCLGILFPHALVFFLYLLLVMVVVVVVGGKYIVLFDVILDWKVIRVDESSLIFYQS